MNTEDKIEERVFDAEAMDRAMTEHIERVGNIEPVNETDKDESPTRTNNLGNVEMGGASFMPPRPKTNLDLTFEGDPNDSTELDMGKSANAGLTRDDSLTATRLLDKNWSPLIVRKYQMESWPLYIGIICDCNLNDLDTVIYDARDEAEKFGFLDGNIQDVRNFVGYLSDAIKKHYNAIKKGSVEGVAVLWYVDKMFCSSLDGDFMTHYSCKMELYQIVNTLPHI